MITEHHKDDLVEWLNDNRVHALSESQLKDVAEMMGGKPTFCSIIYDFKDDLDFNSLSAMFVVVEELGSESVRLQTFFVLDKESLAPLFEIELEHVPRDGFNRSCLSIYNRTDITSADLHELLINSHKGMLADMRVAYDNKVASAERNFAKIKAVFARQAVSA